MNKLLAAAVVALLLCAGLTACTSAESATPPGPRETISFGYTPDFNGASLLAIAQDEGMWRRAGLVVHPRSFADGPTQIQAMGSHDLDYGYIGPGAVWLPASGQGKIIAIDDLGGADRVIAQPGITSMADLKGKKIGVPIGTSGDMILQLALDNAGMTRSDVQIVPMDPPTVVSAFESGQIAAAGIFYPLIDQIRAKVPHLVELARNSDFSDTFSFPTAFVTGDDTAARDPEQVARVVSVLRQAMDYRAAHPADAITMAAGMLKEPAGAVRTDASHDQVMTAETLDSLTRDGTVDGWFDALETFFITAGKLNETVDPSTFYLGKGFVAAQHG